MQCHKCRDAQVFSVMSCGLKHRIFCCSPTAVAVQLGFFFKLTPAELTVTRLLDVKTFSRKNEVSILLTFLNKTQVTPHTHRQTARFHKYRLVFY